MIDYFASHPWTVLFVASIIPFFGMPLVIPLGYLLLGPDYLFTVTLYSTAINIILSIGTWFAGDTVVSFLQNVPAVKRPIHSWQKWSQKKANKYVQSYGIWTVAFVTLLPLPNSGAYTSTFVAKILGYRFSDFMIGIIIGSIICGLFMCMLVFSLSLPFRLVL